MKIGDLGQAVSSEIARRIEGLDVGALLVTQAKRRISSGGDASVQYPDLWDHPKSYRRGGQPLRDTGRLQNSLFSEQSSDGETVTATLKSGVSYAKSQQEGFKTKGPNFIPLTRKAKRNHRPGGNPADEGLVRGEDYIIAWNGVDVPARPIFNMDPLSVNEIVESIKIAARGTG